MAHLEDVSVEDLQRALAEVEEKKPTQRLMAAIAYKNGVTQTELAEWYDVQRRTIYSWLTRLDDGPLTHAVYDDERSGRPRKLTDDQQVQVREVLHEQPTEYGFDEPTWTPSLFQRYLRETYDVEYSIPSCRRLMKESGLRFRKTKPSDLDVDDDREGWWVPQ
jgi:transposase